MARDPYCGNCSYSLKGLTESSKCPECGKPLVEVLERASFMQVGKRYTSKVRIFGLPLLSVARGPAENEKFGRATGIIAIGDVATGILAMGAVARGVLAFGASAFGLVAIGSMAIGLVAFGGLSVGLIAIGGLVIALAGYGGVVLAHTVSAAGVACGVFARGGAVRGTHVLSGTRIDQEALNYFRDYAWFFGGASGLQLGLWGILCAFVIAAIAFLLVALGYIFRRTEDEA